MIEAREQMFGGQMPFAMRSCEKAVVQPVSGTYNQILEKWEGLEAMAPTLTLTAAPGGSDNDADY